MGKQYDEYGDSIEDRENDEYDGSVKGRKKRSTVDVSLPDIAPDRTDYLETRKKILI